MSEERKQIHATCVAVAGRGVLLRGPSGSGKSDLALRLIAEGARLVADDQCLLRRAGDRLYARAPEPIAGRIEARGLGILDLPAEAEAPVALVVDLVSRKQLDRLPEDRRDTLLGLDLPLLALDPFDGSATAKLRFALGQGGARRLDPERDAGAHPEEAGREASPEPAARQGTERMRIVVVTGLSGAGRSTALKALEDLGYDAIDNLPLNFVPAIVAEARQEAPLDAPLAIGLDIRSRNFAADPVIQALDALRALPNVEVTLLFLDAEDEVLRRRYTETRRRHPLAQERPLTDGIVAERSLVEPLRRRADLMIDTSALTTAELRRVLSARLAPENAPGMAIFVTSFSYRKGLPREADLVFDARFLRNPHYDALLRPMCGLDQAVVDYIADDPDFASFYANLLALLRPLLPRYAREGKSYLTVAIGCTGGQHRSVAIAEALGEAFRAEGFPATVTHRDLPSTALPPDEGRGRRSGLRQPSETG